MSLSEKEILQYLYEKKNSLKIELEKVNQAILAFDGEMKIDQVSNSKSMIGMNIPSQYDEKLKIDFKIIFVLSVIKNGDKNSIVDKILEYEPRLDKNKLIRNVSVRLSYLLKNNVLNATKTGRSYDYFLSS